MSNQAIGTASVLVLGLATLCLAILLSILLASYLQTRFEQPDEQFRGIISRLAYVLFASSSALLFMTREHVFGLLGSLFIK